MSGFSAIVFEIKGVLMFASIFVLLRVLLTPVTSNITGFQNVFLINVFVLVVLVLLMIWYAISEQNQNGHVQGAGHNNKLSYYKTRILINILIFLLCGHLWKHCHHLHFRDDHPVHSKHNSKHFPESVIWIYHTALSATSTVCLVRIIMTLFENLF